jgi:hypothetical protein
VRQISPSDYSPGQVKDAAKDAGEKTKEAAGKKAKEEAGKHNGKVPRHG